MKELNLNDNYLLKQSINQINSFCILHDLYFKGFSAKKVLISLNKEV